MRKLYLTGAAVARVELLQRLEQRSASLESQVALSQTTKSWCEVNIFVNTVDDLDSTTVQVPAIVPASPWLTIYICYHLVMCRFVVFHKSTTQSQLLLPILSFFDTVDQNCRPLSKPACCRCGRELDITNDHHHRIYSYTWYQVVLKWSRSHLSPRSQTVGSFILNDLHVEGFEANQQFHKLS